MATDLGRVKSTASNKHDAFVASQLKQAATRIRMLDLTAGLLGFTALGLIYVVVMVLCDSKLLLSQQARQLSLYVFLAGSLVYLFFTVFRPLGLRVNPYYAARQVEQQLPNAKNSIVNWVDLHEQSLPPAIRGALGQRAAKDLGHVDLERAISGRRAAWMGGLAGLFAVVFAASFFLLGPAPFLSLLKRTFNPFEAVGVSTRTRLMLLKPEGGNAIVTVGRGVNFEVEVGGKVPDPKAADAPKLLYRYEEGDPWIERRLVQESSGEWTAALSAIDVKNGFWYRITGGDAATEEYRIGVRAAPTITDFLATYRFRPYVARAEEIHRERELKALRGTEVLLRVRTNRVLREGRLELEGKGGTKSVRGEIDADEAHTLLVRSVIDEDGKYRLCFTSTDGEAYRDPVSYPVTAIPDRPPAVELTKPGQDIRLPADALLHLEGKASDDIGVQSVVLQMRVIGGDKLRAQPYRSDEQIRLTDGGYPRQLEYKDFVELSRVKSENGHPAQLRSGMELEYWLVASDACDYPRANVGESKHYRVLLTDPEKNDPKKKQEKNQAEKEKEQHEQKQDQKLQNENQERQQQRQDQEARNKEEENKARSGSEANKGGAGEKQQPKEGEQANNSDRKEDSGQQEQNKSGQGEPNNGEQKSELSKEDQSIENRIKKALEKKGAGANGKEKSNPDKSDPGQAKTGQPDKSQGKAAGNKTTGENKDKGQSQAGPGKSGENRDKPKTAPQQGNDKPSSDSQSGKDASPETPQPKGHDPDSAKGKRKSPQDNGANDRKEDGKTDRKQDHASPKEDPSKSGKANPSGDRKEGGKSAKGENKPEAGSSARQATSKDVADLKRSLQSKDARERENAKQQLQRVAQEANDPQARDKAEDALKKLGKPDGPTNKPNSEGKKSDKGDNSKDARSTGEKGGKDESSGQKNGPSDKKQQGATSKESSPGTPASQNGTTPGGGGDRRSAENLQGQSSADPQPNPPAKPRDHRAAQMQLEDFAKKVNKDILKEAGVSEEAWKKYLQTKRKQLEPREKARPEALNAPRQASQLPSMGGKTIQPAASGQGEAHGPDRGQPPPGYRDSFREFTRQMSKGK